MKNYEVSFYYDLYGKMTVEAESLEDAEAKVKSILSEDGIEDEASVNITDRAYSTTGSKEISYE